ncbi:hypothetical protein AWC38_SpisGene19729 [Stylophora pistillata]|uniref:DZIP3-like HEPN domain-containing protein n=1 Tax=Stylophora pistillata TaxID=50429 RepID=A0A2B4RIE4_STYPI|nr:hypothetical protein AWC38_SpisGene19729 [Stylophora pistillata]
MAKKYFGTTDLFETGPLLKFRYFTNCHGLDRDSLPLDLDFSKNANIVRLKYFNDVVYSHANQASVDDATFNFYWQDISAAKVVLGGFGYRSAIGKLKNKCMDPLMEVKVKEVMGETQENIRSGFDQLRVDIGKLIDSSPPLKAVQVTKD